MAGADDFLIDASAVGRMLRPDVIEAWRGPISSGQVRICEATMLELLRTARTPEEFEAMRVSLDAVFTWCPMHENAFRRALERQARLTERGVLGSSTAGLVLVATAGHLGLTILHYDAELEALCRLLGQPARWLAEPGSID